MRLTLSTNISRLRKERSMTQEQLAEALGYNGPQKSDHTFKK